MRFFLLESWWNMKEEALQDVVERLVRIETKLDNYESLREKADSAKDLADKAYSIALNNAEDIKEMNYKAYVELARDSAMKYGIPLTLDTPYNQPGIKSHLWVTQNIWGII